MRCCQWYRQDRCRSASLSCWSDRCRSRTRTPDDANPAPRQCLIPCKYQAWLRRSHCARGCHRQQLPRSPTCPHAGSPRPAACHPARSPRPRRSVLCPTARPGARCVDRHWPARRTRWAARAWPAARERTSVSVSTWSNSDVQVNLHASSLIRGPPSAGGHALWMGQRATDGWQVTEMPGQHELSSQRLRRIPRKPRHSCEGRNPVPLTLQERDALGPCLRRDDELCCFGAS